MNEAYAVCRKIIHENSKSFSLAARLLPASARDSAIVVYAWCRRADDAIDKAEDERELAPAINRLRAELDGIVRGERQADPVLEAFRQVVHDRRIPMAYPSELIAGMEMDVTTRTYESVDDLLLYCHRAAGVVGLMMCHVLGVRDDHALRHAAHLGIAMQLTNICRDVAEDRERGRCYLPLSMMTNHAAVLSGLGDASSLNPAEFREPVRRLLALADDYYASADRGMSYLDGRTAWAIRTARLVYSEIGRSLAKQGHDVTTGRAFVSRRRKMELLASAGLKTLMQAAGGAAWRPRIPERVLEFADAVRLDGASLSIGVPSP